MERVILHSDANCFYASVETVLNPNFRGKAIAVCGLQEERHGIILAKSEKAKRAGVKTGMAIWQAKQCCPNLLIVPPHYNYYLKFSKLLHGIYQRYTDRVEAFGMDECWLDVTGCRQSGVEIAEEIRQAVKDELGLTVSIGVSFNKVFAKLGSDYKKPDAITEISRENFKDIVWPLHCSELLYCGPAATAKMERICVRTIGDLANLPVETLRYKLGKNGVQLWNFANGLDNSEVAHQDYTVPAKSVGHGITCTEDLNNIEEAKAVIYALSQDIGYKLRAMHLRANGISVCVKDSSLNGYSWQIKPETASNDEFEIAKTAINLVMMKYKWHKNIRALTVTAIELENNDAPRQLNMFVDNEKSDKRMNILESIDNIRDKFGKKSILPCVVLGEKKMPKDRDKEIILPGYIGR